MMSYIPFQAPWKKIVRSPPFWALVTLHFSEAWVLTSMTTFIPLYMDDVLKFSIKEVRSSWWLHNVIKTSTKLFFKEICCR